MNSKLPTKPCSSLSCAVGESFWVCFGYLCFWSAFHYWRAAMTVSAMVWADPSDKAISLFLSWLNPTQRKDYLRHDYFYVKGSDSGKLYRINKAVAPFNVEMLNFDGTTKDRLCFVPRNCPFTGDIMLAQKIALETNEKEALRVANHYNRWHNQTLPMAGVNDMC